MEIGNSGTSFTDELLNSMRALADPEADQLLERLVADSGAFAAKQLFDTLITHVEMPVEQLPMPLQEFIANKRTLPAWADPEKIKKAQELFIDHGPKFLIFLYYKSLPLLYSNAKGAEVLVQTGRLAHQEKGFDQFSRRIAETGQFLLDVMAPGGFDGGMNAIIAALKVRLIHASIRQFIPPDKWDSAVLGKPINQEDLALTLMTFSISILDALEQTGIDEEKDRQEAYMHVWKLIGHFLGISHDLFPESLEDARALINKILDRQSRKSEAGILLTKALMDFADKNLPEEVLKDAPEVLLRFYSGDVIADLLEVHPSYGCLMSWLPSFLKSVFSIGEKLEERSPVLKDLIDRISVKAAKRMVNYFNTSKQANFQIPESLKTAWFEEDNS